jgi:cyclopropane fatty-acyl-phospholipid synthase-like methyltransferase
MINKKGFWEDNNISEHKYDKPLSDMLVNIFKENNINTVLDMGCGPGMYAENFNKNNIECDCCDGNPFTPELTNGKCFVSDLSEPIDFKKKYDCVLSLEVGEHIPQEYEHIFIDNILKHSKDLIILSWATVGQGGHGHFNEKPNDYIELIFRDKNHKRNKELETKLRESSHWWWFKNTIMVFEKI